jgi:hypothetical protein
MLEFSGSSARIRLGLLVLVLSRFSRPASATCASYIDFGQLFAECGGGTTYCYVVSPGVNTADSILSSFWSLKNGHPTVGPGSDNGSWEGSEGWLIPYGPGTYLAGSWSTSPEIDGCIDGSVPPGKPTEIMVVGLSDTDFLGSHGYFAVAAVRRDRLDTPQFDFAGGLRTDIDLTLIPRPLVVSVERTPPESVIVGVDSPRQQDIQPGFFTDGTTSFGEAIVGYRLYRGDVEDYGPPPSDRHRTAWTAVSGVMPIGLPSFITIECRGQSRTYLAMALVFDSGFETGYVSENSVAISVCGWCIHDIDGDGFFTDVECEPWDCNDFDPATHPWAPETNDGTDNQCPGDPGYGVIDEISGKSGFFNSGDKTEFSWPAQALATSYEVVRSGSPDFAGPCFSASTTSTSWSDPEVPSPEGMFCYLVRSTAPHSGSWGQDSSGSERLDICP